MEESIRIGEKEWQWQQNLPKNAADLGTTGTTEVSVWSSDSSSIGWESGGQCSWVGDLRGTSEGRREETVGNPLETHWKPTGFLGWFVTRFETWCALGCLLFVGSFFWTQTYAEVGPEIVIAKVLLRLHMLYSVPCHLWTLIFQAGHLQSFSFPISKCQGILASLSMTAIKHLEAASWTCYLYLFVKSIYI